MKKFLTASALALALVACTQQTASAWINSQFSVGLTWNFSCGSNRGLFGGHCHGQDFGGMGMGMGMGMPMFSPGCTGDDCYGGMGMGYGGLGMGGMGYGGMGAAGTGYNSPYMPASYPGYYPTTPMGWYGQ
jgi:hypothetical protein